MKLIKSIIPLIFLYSCAQIVIPDGGQKDEKPPALLKSIPQQKTLGVYPSNIDLYFDENVEVKNPSENISVTPEISSIPKIKVKKNKIELQLEKDSLKPNTTYCINFGNSIVDVNEGNILENFYYTFSTGNSIDTAAAYGRILTIKENKPAEKSTVILKNIFTSANYKTFTDKKGEWIINNIASGNYSLLVFKDNNSNQSLDMYEFYYQDTININDRPKSITSKLIEFQPNLNSLNLKTVKCNYINENTISLKLNKPPITTKSIKYSFDTDLTKKDYFNIISTNKPDSFLILHPYSVKDTLILTIQTDTLQIFTIPQPKKRKKEIISLSAVNLISRKGDPIYITSTIPIKLINSDKIKINGQSSGFAITNITPYKLSVSSNDNASNEIIFDSGALTDINGEENRGDTIIIKVATDEETGSYEFVIKDTINNYKGTVIAKISNSFNEYTITTELNKINKIKGLLPSNYSIEIWEDENSNGLWDEGNYYEKKNPEKIILLKDFISIKPNWDTVGVEIYID